jgi:Cell division protein CrgA
VARTRAKEDQGAGGKKVKAQGGGRGRVTPSNKSRELNRRYTAPIPRNVRRSPPWFGPVLLVLLVVGLFLIVGNYVGILPGGTSNWYLIGGLVGIVIGALMATQYH